MGIKKILKIAFFTGLILLFTSIFLDWYIFQAFNTDGTPLAYWTYNIFSEWSTNGNIHDEQLKPNNLFVPIMINIVFIIVILMSAFGMAFKGFEKEKELNKLYPFAFINIFLLLLIGFYIFIFPIVYLISNDLYFPFLMLSDRELEVVYFYCVGPGYLLQLFAFGLIFPHAVFYYQTIMKYEIEKHSPVKVIEKYIEHVQEPLDLDKFIAEEELKQKFEKITSNEEIDQVYDEFIKSRC